MVDEELRAKELIDSIIPDFSGRKLIDSDEIVNVLLDLRKILDNCVIKEDKDGRIP